MKRKDVPYTKKKVVFVITISILLIILCLSSLFIGALMQSYEMDPKIYLPFCLAFFPISIIGIIFMIYHYPGLVQYDFENKLKKNKMNGFEKIDTYIDDISDICMNNKFKPSDEYYYKKKISFFKDYVNYYIKSVFSIDIQKTIEIEFEKIDDVRKSNKCFILFIYKESVTKTDLDNIIEIVNPLISIESVLPNAINITSIIVLLDPINKCSYIVPPTKNKLSFYNIGYKFVIKTFFSNYMK